MGEYSLYSFNKYLLVMNVVIVVMVMVDFIWDSENCMCVFLYFLLGVR